jgi:hypothetical protein
MPDVYIPEAFEIMPQKRFYLLRAGFKGTTHSINDKLKEEINNVYLYGLELSKPKVVFNTLPVDILANSLIPHSFKGVKLITFFASTLGKDIDNFISNSNMLISTLLDAWASEAIEALNSTFDEKLRKQSGHGTRRFSPGYDDIDIRKNYDIVKNLLKTDIVTVNQNTGIITPRKSTICMIGWYSG